MEITYNFGHVFYPGADKVMNAKTLRRMIDLLVGVNVDYLLDMRRRGLSVPPLYRSGVYYRRARLWEPIPDLYGRQWGDCKNLAPALIAEYLVGGVKCLPTFRWAENPDGTVDYHILVQNGQNFEDPSKVLGMGADEVARFYK